VLWVGGGVQYNKTETGPEAEHDTFTVLRNRKEALSGISALRKKFGSKYRTNELVKLELESKYVMMAQRMLRTLSLSVDYNAANSFQLYAVGELKLEQHRIGIMYGRVVDHHAFCDVIYEPPQDGDADGYNLKNDTASVEERLRADRLASLLGLRPVGIIFTAQTRKCIFSSRDVFTLCRFQQEVEDAMGFDVARSCVAAVITRNETTNTVGFEAYQISDLCRDMYRSGIFEEPAKHNKAHSKTKEDVRVEGLDARKVDNDFFICAVPIKSHKLPLFDNRQAEFSVENRPHSTQNALEVKHILKCHELLPMSQRISDFHMLLYLSRFLHPVKDMPVLCKAVLERGLLSDAHLALINSLSQL